MDTGNRQEGRETMKKQVEGGKKIKDTILDQIARQGAGSVGTIDTFVKRKREEEDRLEVERKLLGKFKKTRRMNDCQKRESDPVLKKLRKKGENMNILREIREEQKKGEEIRKELRELKVRFGSMRRTL